jgi:hypothetical protein
MGWQDFLAALGTGMQQGGRAGTQAAQYGDQQRQQALANMMAIMAQQAQQQRFGAQQKWNQMNWDRAGDWRVEDQRYRTDRDVTTDKYRQDQLGISRDQAETSQQRLGFDREKWQYGIDNPPPDDPINWNQYKVNIAEGVRTGQIDPSSPFAKLVFSIKQPTSSRDLSGNQILSRIGGERDVRLKDLRKALENINWFSKCLTG